MSIRKLTVTAGLGILLVAFAIMLVLLPTREPTVKVDFSFTGYTTDSRSNLVAKFRVVNESKGRILRLGIYHLDSSQHPFDSLNPTNFFGLSPFNGRLLAPRQSGTITIPAVTNQGPWRATLRFESYGWRRAARNWVGPVPTKSIGGKLVFPMWRLRLDRWLATPAHPGQQ